MTRGETATGVRLDAWLWAARFYKTRSLAKQSLMNGRVAIDGSACKPSRPLHVGDRLQITRGDECFEIEVLALADKRSSAAVAQMLYHESDDSRAKREVARGQRRAERAGYRAPQGKPDKRARRLIKALGDIEAM